MALSSIASALEPWAVVVDAAIGIALVAPPLFRWIQIRRRQYDRLAVLNHLLALYADLNPSSSVLGWNRLARNLGAGLGGAASGAINSIVVIDAGRALGTWAGPVLGGAAGLVVVILSIELAHRLVPTPRERQARLRRELVLAESRIL